MTPTFIQKLTHWTHGHLKYLEQCPYCKAKLSKTTYSRKDDNAAWIDIWTLYKCQTCRSIYLNPRPDIKSLPKAYQNYYTHTNAENNRELSDHSIITSLINGYLNRRFSMQRTNSNSIGYWFFKYLIPLRMKLDIYGRHIPKFLCNSNTKLLDIGCGNGDFLLRAKEMGITTYGLENDPLTVKYLQNLGIRMHLGELSSANYPKKKFDYITLNHVIEHVENPQTLLNEIFPLLKDDGFIWLGLPNPRALGITIFKQAWKGFHPPFHLFIPSQRSLKKMLENSGFVNIRFIPLGLQSKGLWQESHKISQQEKIHTVNIWTKLVFIFTNFISSFSSKYAEETIVIAQRPKGN